MGEFKPTHTYRMGRDAYPCMIVNWHWSRVDARAQVKFPDGDIITGLLEKSKLTPLKRNNDGMSYVLYREDTT